MRPRIRTLKPEIWQDEKVGDLSHAARLLYVGLITMADDEGRVRELPAAITGQVFPYDGVAPSKLARWLDEVSVAGLVVRYVAHGKRYLAFPHWKKHQRVDKPNVSELPAPPDESPNGSGIDLGSDRGSVLESIEDQSCPPRAGASLPIPSHPDPPSRKESKPGARDVADVFAYWQERCNHPNALLTADRRAKIRARLNEGYSQEQIRQAIDGAAKSPFVNEQGKRFDDIELICRNGSKFEDFMERASAEVVPFRVKPAAADRNDWQRGYPEGA